MSVLDRLVIEDLSELDPDQTGGLTFSCLAVTGLDFNIYFTDKDIVLQSVCCGSILDPREKGSTYYACSQPGCSTVVRLVSKSSITWWKVFSLAAVYDWLTFTYAAIDRRFAAEELFQALTEAHEVRTQASVHCVHWQFAASENYIYMRLTVGPRRIAVGTLQWNIRTQTMYWLEGRIKRSCRANSWQATAEPRLAALVGPLTAVLWLQVIDEEFCRARAAVGSSTALDSYAVASKLKAFDGSLAVSGVCAHE